MAASVPVRMLFEQFVDGLIVIEQFFFLLRAFGCTIRTVEFGYYSVTRFNFNLSSGLYTSLVCRLDIFQDISRLTDHTRCDVFSVTLKTKRAATDSLYII